MCWSSDALRARSREREPVKGIHTFDKSDPARSLAPANPVPAAQRGAIRRVKLPAGRKLIALTFDLCETPGEVAGYDGAIVDYLRDHNIKATFFTGGKWMRSHSERTQQLLSDPLFEMANHSETHRNLRLLHGKVLSDEINAPQRAYESLVEGYTGRQCRRGDGTIAKLPARMTLFRFPFGACDPESLNAVNDAGLLAIQWDLSTGDPWRGQKADAITRAMIEHTKPGSIIISHANGRGYHTAEALPAAIPALLAKGFEFVTVSELLAAGTPEIAATCYDTRPGDTDKYDSFFAPKPAAKPATETPHAPGSTQR